MLKINASGSSIHGILIMLEVYKEYQHLYNRTKIDNNFQIALDGIPCYGVYEIDKIFQDPSKIIFIDLTSEGIHCISYLKKLDNTKKYVIFSNGWWDESYYDIGIDYTLIPWNVFLYDYVQQVTLAQSINYFVNTPYQIDSPKTNLFCSLNGQNKSERTKFVNLISDFDFPYILTYNGTEIKGNSKSFDIEYDFNQYNVHRMIGKSCEYHISRSIPTIIYNSSRFNLIIETNINLMHEFHLTEKTIKCLITGIPFVLMAGPGYLQKLKSLGFKTFDNLWSEEYDQIEDFDDRMAEIVKLINLLNDFDWDNHRDSLIEIAQYNRLHLAYFNNTLMKRQLDKLDNLLLHLSDQGY